MSTDWILLKKKESRFCRDAMSHIETAKLSDVLQLVPKPTYVLGTTYSLSLAFFESVVLPCINTSNLKQCLLISDRLGYQRSLCEGPALIGAGQDYMIEPAPMSDAFHSKVWLLLGENEGLLLVGSGNLTQSGFINNAELFEALHFTKEKPVSDFMLASIRSFLKGLAGLWPSSNYSPKLCTEILGRIHDALDDLPMTTNPSSSTQFIHSFTAPIIDQFPDVPEAKELFIAAPFFGKSTSGLKLLVDRYPRANIHIFPAVHLNNTTDCPLSDIRLEYKLAKMSRLHVEAKKDAFPHLKLYGIHGDADTAWICCTSANCTTSALRGDNVEAGILREIPRATLDEYFVPDKAALPAGSFSYATDLTGGDTIDIWATDSGGGLDVSIAESSANRLPLRDVTLSIRAGSLLVSCQKATLFCVNSFVQLPWSEFTGWQRQGKTALCLDLRGTDTVGVAVRAACFVENRMLLTADPLQRNALRGAQAMLDSENVPDFADVAAIFSLARDLFDGRLFNPQPDETSVKIRGDQSTSQPTIVAIPVWPPEDHVPEVHKKLGPTRSGQLKMFQRIMATFLRNDRDPELHRSPNARDVPDDSDEANESSVSEKRRVEEQRKACAAAEKRWRHANDNFETLCDRLRSVEPSESQAPNLWYGAIFLQLAAMAVLMDVRRKIQKAHTGTEPEFLCDEFLTLMLHPRKQDEDYCASRGSRYRGETFPILAADLKTTFHVHVHRDISVIMLAMIVDKKLRTADNLYPDMWRRYIGLVCEPDLQLDPETIESCRRMWRRFICGELRRETDADFLAALDSLWKNR